MANPRRIEGTIQINVTRDEMVAMLTNLAEGWEHLGNDRLARQSAWGATALVEGASSVRVGHTVYVVTEP